MAEALKGIRLFAASGAQSWYQSGRRNIFLSDVVDSSSSKTMGVGFARYAPGEANEWTVTYDEVLIVTRGTFIVTSKTGDRATANAGELIFLTKGTEVIYSAGETGAELTYVTYPHWMDAQQNSAHAALLDTFHPIAFHPVNDPPPQLAKDAADDNLALMRKLWGPLERGESENFQPFFDVLADDVVLKVSLGELRGKQSVINYFVNASATIDFQPFEKPLQYYASGDRVVIVGDETFTLKDSGLTHQAEWAWVIDVHEGLITRISAIQDLSGVAGAVGEALAKAQSHPGTH